MIIKETNREVLYANNAILNKPGFESTAAVSYDLQVEGSERSVWCHGYLNIAGCDRSITLQIDFDDEDTYKNSIHKLTTLNNIVEEIIADLIKTRVKYVEFESKIKEDDTKS